MRPAEARRAVVGVVTDQGTARWHVGRARRPRCVLALGHGAGGGVETADLARLAEALPPLGCTVLRFEQPWRVAGRRVAVGPPRLDEAWEQGLAAAAGLRLVRDGLPLVVGGRSAGARCAVRTASRVGAAAALALAFPLHPPGSPGRSRSPELTAAGVPVLVVQGERDPFGRPAELRSAVGRADVTVVAVPGADHGFGVSSAGPLTRAEALDVVVQRVVEWLDRVLAGAWLASASPA